MKRMAMFTAVAVVMAGAMAQTASPVLAGGFQQERVASTAKWVVHLDAEAATASTLVQFVMQQPDAAAKLAKAVKECQDKAGFDPTKDLKSVTLYGTDYTEKAGVAVVQGKVDRDKLLALLAKNEGHQEIAYGNVTIQQWTEKHGDKQQTKYGCFYGDDLVVAGGDLDNVKLAVDVLAGKKDNLSKGPLAAILPTVSPGRIVMMAGQDLVIPAKAKRAAMLKKLQTLTIEMGELKGKAFVNISGTAATAKDADRLRTMLTGMIALAGLITEDEGPVDLIPGAKNPFLVDVAQLAGGVTVGGADKTITVTGSWDVEVLKKVAAKAIEIQKAVEAAKKAKQQPAATKQP